MISTPTAIRSFSRWTASSILRSSFNMPSTMSGADSLSMARVAGLICSVGSDCHFERTGMRIKTSGTSRGYYHSRQSAGVSRRRGVASSEFAAMDRESPAIDAYLDHLRVERRLAAHTLESYARDLTALAEYAAGTSRPSNGWIAQRSKRSFANSAREGSRRARSPDPSPPSVDCSAFWCSTGVSTAALPTISGRRAPGQRCRPSSRSSRSIR